MDFRSLPASPKVLAATSNAVAVAIVPMVVTGGYHSLALKSDGTIWSWGYNQYGQLGDGSAANRAIPAQIQGLSNISTVSAGYGDSFAIDKDGVLWGWGRNDCGQVGNATSDNQAIPVRVGRVQFSAVSAGQNHTVALDANGAVWSWGYNAYGMLGLGYYWPWLYARTPQQILFAGSIFTARALAAGYDHTLALKQDGTVWAWGHNNAGQLGNGARNDMSSPLQVRGLTGVVAIAAGYESSLALKSDGTVWAWGWNGSGQLGNGTTADSPVPVQVSNLSDVVAISSGYQSNAALKKDGTVWTWGVNAGGQLGNGTTASSSVPVQVQNLTNIISVGKASQSSHVLAIGSDGTVWGWGRNAMGQLATGSTQPTVQTTPVKSLISFNVVSPDISGAAAAAAISQTDPSQIDSNTLVSDPVDSATGSQTIRQTLLKISGAQTIPVEVEYNSLLLNKGPLGKGWGHNFETRLEALSDGTVKIHWISNRANTFSNAGNNQFTSKDKATRYDNLVKNSDDSYALTRKDQSVYLFNSSGQLTELKNSHGQPLALSYDSVGNLQKVADPLSGQALNFTYTAQGLIDKVSDNANRQVSFDYDANSNLTAITDPLGNTTSQSRRESPYFV